MRWAIFWKVRSDGPWVPWCDQLFSSRTAAVDFWMDDHRLLGTTEGRGARQRARYRMKRDGLRLCPARIEPEAPRIYLGDDS